MTPEERKLVIELFDRLATLEDAQRDPDAERLIKDGMRQAPNAPYALVQTVLVQDEALKRANARLRQLESGNEAPARDTSFLGAMRDTVFGARENRGSVPSVRSGASSLTSDSGMSAAWRTGTQPAAPGWVAGAAPAAPFASGGSFLGTAASTAAGVIGGALLLDGIRSMMGHHGGAHAAFDQHAAGSSPWSGSDSAGGGLSREAGLGDVGRPSHLTDNQDGGYGLVNDSDPDDGDTDMDDVDDGGFDDGSEDV
jgi:uncharacterized protein